jgi:hypothetical protein
MMSKAYVFSFRKKNRHGTKLSSVINITLVTPTHVSLSTDPKVLRVQFVVVKVLAACNLNSMLRQL